LAPQYIIYFILTDIDSQGKVPGLVSRTYYIKLLSHFKLSGILDLS